MIKVLVVEDNEIIRRAMVDELLLDKFSVAEAMDGEEALAKIISKKPDIVILDIMLPKMNGLEVFKKIRGNPLIAETKVVVFTNIDADDKMIEELSSLNPCFYLNKARLRLEELPEKIKACFSS
ncbi:MAG: hypothetical protein A3C06_00950 [Candidatus Taylorbacteria bacterium RIFCSPHIGHO2_02_FULL_46_13]|uniref:Response regulatory domain-containing protein n=2 Tax=Parcubacteria group TaxID=1794811 RepID=A0A1G2HVH8_9BACT|nr:MAG: hypothetical protein A2822_01390 [Candidatus Staskawiczbacteria bacterium RIFCSPHIGHO2_01_FULL_41_41]OHA27269.1 MAG: hypothetical protein A3C06_00950 [Candidatus Taylorbacteria bacterium RIFCSPHIGHO2_02_FULL_46_13]